MCRSVFILCLLAVPGLTTATVAFAAERPADPPNIQLREWGKGIAIDSLRREGMSVYLWFYEWNLFHARQQGQHTRGSHDWERSVKEEGQTAVIDAGDMKLTVRAVEDGADLTLEIANQTDYPWPDIAGIIPCFNPGAPTDQAKRYPQAKINQEFENQNTWFVGKDGLQKLVGRDIHFNFQLRRQVDEQATEGEHPFSYKWPTSREDSYQGLIVRESNDGRWVTGIAWERFLSAQGHNPWSCMHLAINVGPLRPQQSRTIHGRIYLFPGTREQCYERFQKDLKH